MDAEKIRNTTDVELQHQERELSDQLFRLKFQMKMGQTESLQKIRGLRKDIARIKTVMRERALGARTDGAVASPAAEKKAAPKVTASAASAPEPAAKKSGARTVASKRAKKSEKK